MKVEKRGGFSDKVSCLAGFFGGFLAHVKCLWSEGQNFWHMGRKVLERYLTVLLLTFNVLVLTAILFGRIFKKAAWTEKVATRGTAADFPL